MVVQETFKTTDGIRVVSLVCDYLLLPDKSTFQVCNAAPGVPKWKGTELPKLLGIFSYRMLNAEHGIQAQFGTKFQHLEPTRPWEPIYIFSISRFSCKNLLTLEWLLKVHSMTDIIPLFSGPSGHLGNLCLHCPLKRAGDLCNAPFDIHFSPKLTYVFVNSNNQSNNRINFLLATTSAASAIEPTINFGTYTTYIYIRKWKKIKKNEREEIIFFTCITCHKQDTIEVGHFMKTNNKRLNTKGTAQQKNYHKDAH